MVGTREQPFGRRGWRLPLAIAIVSWVVVGALCVVAAMRIVAWDDIELFAVLNTLTAFVYLPAWVIAPLAFVGHRFVLGCAALGVVLAQVVFMVPELTATEPLPSWVASAPTFRILDANVYQGNPSMGGYAREIVAFRPEVVTLEEANPVDARQLERSGVLRHLPYRFDVPRYDSTAYVIASAFPMEDVRISDLYGHPLVVQLRLMVPSAPVELWVAHTVAPLPSSFAEWRHQLQRIADLVGERGTKGLLLVGDFNATWGNRGFHAILDTGLTDGAAARGRPFDMTWSQTKRPLPPLVRIDHVLTGSGVEVVAIRTGAGPGSDHRDEMATIAVRA